MLILASEISGSSVSVAAWRDGSILGELNLRNGAAHSATYLPLLEHLIKQCGFQMGDVDLFAVTTGPGSFTGIRIGISAVKAMAYAAGRRVVGVSTLEALAWPYRILERTMICPMLDARNGRIYASAWLNGIAVIQEDGRPMTSFLEEARQTARSRSDCNEILLLGCQPPPSFMNQEQSPDCPAYLAPASSWLPRAAAVAEIAAVAFSEDRTVPPQDLKASYLALSSAERLKDAKHA
ncbi:MAG: tRNA (adenosine(37)-N6)-threonylcarbamoyltransferase complex dimerization subunit type 1 TsaB [Clostridiaceae bacterium]|nr:tRNA (adenosine(37)-N6)-threonylcarbamoyltransferase complex dimerization subunit type 1 TsaB [Clostridiaceae bacterium]